MRKLFFAIALAGITSAAVCATSQAAPIAPLPAAQLADSNGVVQAHYWYHHRYYHRHWYHHRYWYHRHYWYHHGYYHRHWYHHHYW